jgi:hypothetical protein
MPYALALLAVLLAPAEGPSVRGRTEVVASGGRVTVRADRVPLSHLLDRIAVATGMKVTYEGTRPQALVSLDVERLSEVALILKLMEGQATSYVLQTDATGERVASLIVPGTGGGGSATVASNTPPPPPEPEEVVPAYDYVPLDPAVLEAQGGDRPPDRNNPYMGLPVQHFPQAMGAAAPPEGAEPEAPTFSRGASYPTR